MTPNVALRRLRRVLAADPTEHVSDAEWLRRFADGRDEEAFAALVKRHGPMVLNVCHGVLHHGHDAEDVFQAAFLVLAQKAGTIRRGEALGAWLYGVAYRLAVKARARAERRRVRERRVEDVPDPDPMLDMTLREFRALLHEELGRLPEKYRGPLVLCYLEDRTQEEAARQLGCPRGVLRGRLDRGREQLRRRLTRRGVTLSAGLLTVALGQMGAASAVPVGLARATAAAACGPAGQGFPALAGEGGKVMGWTKGKVVGVLFLIGVLGLGAGVLARHRLGTEPPPEKEAGAPERAEVEPRRDLYGDRLPEGAVVRLGSVQLRHGGKVTSVVFTPDGNTLISGGQDNTVRFWDPRTGREVNRLVPHEGPAADHAWVESVAVSPDGKYVAAGTGNGPAAAVVWERATGKLLHRLDGKQGKVKSVAFSRDGKLLASGGADGTVLLWDVATGRKVGTCKGHGGWVEAVAFAPVGDLLASACRDKTVRLWDLKGKELRKLEGPKDTVMSVAFSPDGKTVAGGCWGGGIHLWEAASGKDLGRLPAERQNVSGLVFLPDGRTLVSASWNWGVRFWDLKTGKELRKLAGHRGPIPGLALSPDGKTLATGSWDRTVRLWDVASGKEVLPAKGHTHAVWSVAYSPDGKTLATGCEDGSVRLWEAATGKELRRLGGHHGLVDLLSYSADGKTLATGSWDHQVRIWDVATGKRLKKQLLEGIGFRYSPDRKWLAGGVAGEAAVWLADAATGKHVHEFKGQNGWVTLAFSPDGKLLASGGEKTDGTVVLWDVASGKEVRRLKGIPHRYYALVFSPDGRYLAGTSANTRVYTRQGPIVLWEVATGREVRRFEGHTGTVGSLAFSPDGRTLASGAGDQTVRLWEVATGKQRRSFVGHEGVIRSVAFSPDGRRLASACQDTTGLVWDVTGLGPEGKAPGLTVRERDALWKALRDADALEAYRAVWRLAASPGQALPLLREHLKPLRPADPKRVEKLIGDLASESFEVRRKATAELEGLGDLAEGSLRTHLGKTRELEERRRVEALLARLDVPTGERLRSLRAVEVLEHIGTSGARGLLRELSRGAPGALLTREAKAALGRLGK